MITDLDVARLCNAIYTDPQVVPWEHFIEWEDLTFGMVNVGDCFVVINRGSFTREDWHLDFEAFANPLLHAGLGPVHRGFMKGMENQWYMVKEKCKRLGITKVKFGGHSLGAAHATLQTGLAILDGWMPYPRCVFGEPMSTFQQGADIIDRAGGSSYRNGNNSICDLVTCLPMRFWPELYVHATKMTDVCEPPAERQTLAKEWHHMPLYLRAIERMSDHG